MRKRNFTYFPPDPSPVERDYQLARQALSGDTDAWDTLHLEAFDFVVNAARKCGDSRFFGDSEYSDIASEAFAKCYEQLERYRGLGRFRSWVLGYAKNIMRNRKHRQCTVWRNQYLLEYMVQTRSRNLDPLHLLLQLERDQFLWEAFYLLSPQEQIVLYQRVLFQTSMKKLAKALQLTRKQVKQAYEDALLKTRWHYLRLYC